jgi:ribosomal-protein-alanine N-acetyltransferase
MTELETRRLILRALRPEDLRALHALHNDPLVRARIYGGQPQRLADVEMQLKIFLSQWRENGFGFWMVYEKRAGSEPCFIGRAGLRNFEDTEDLEFGYVFCAAGAGRGLGPEAARACIAHALRNSAKRQVVGMIAPDNAPALHAAAKLGFRHAGDRWRDGKLWHYFELPREVFFQLAAGQD